MDSFVKATFNDHDKLVVSENSCQLTKEGAVKQR